MIRAVLAVAALIGAYDWWAAQASGARFDFKREHGGYYNYLGRAFAAGQLHLPLAPDPALLALENPWDPKVSGDIKMHDMVLYQGRYYLYHGAGPALMLFAPYRRFTGRDLPENFALFLFCFGGFTFSAIAFLRILRQAAVELSPPLTALLLLALGFCTSIPYLFSRIWVYEIAIAAGYFCVALGVWLLTIRANSALTAAGLVFGLAVACRPHLGLVGLLVGVYLIVDRRLAALRYLVPLAACGLAVAAYNYLRFGDPTEFGLRYMLAGPNQNRVVLRLDYIPFGLYYLLVCPPDLTPVFPWVRGILRYPFGSLRPIFLREYFLEGVVGAVYLAPFFPVLLGSFRLPRAVRPLLGTLLVSSLAVLLFLAATGWSTQRYEVDFLPWATFVALAVAAVWLARARLGWWFVFAGLALLGITTNLTLAIAGPYNTMLTDNPQRYFQIASLFSLTERVRPHLNPALKLRLKARLPPGLTGRGQPLLTLGHQSFGYCLYVQPIAGGIKLVSHTDRSQEYHAIAQPLPEVLQLDVEYDPASRTLTVRKDEAIVITHVVPILLTAPAEITPGENRTSFRFTAPRFMGPLEVYWTTPAAAP